MGKFIKDVDQATQIWRQHILIGRFTLEDLQKYDKFYTLQGNAALMQVRVVSGSLAGGRWIIYEQETLAREIQQTSIRDESLIYNQT